jgi:hypothetical protein
MLKILLMSFIFSIASCSVKHTIDVKELINNRSLNNESKIKSRGYIFIENNYDIKLYQNKNDKDFIDIVFTHKTIVDKTFESHKFICVDIIGKFLEFNNDRIGTGNFTSKYGYIVVDNINRCN